MAAKVYCELGDATITTNEIEILRSDSAWLNDTIITFCLELWKKTSPRKDTVLIQPSAAFMLRLLPPEDLTASIPPGGNPFVDAKSDVIHFVCLPVNNASDPDAAGGSHWSLLIIDKLKQIAIHMDSANGMNRRVARETAQRMGALLEMNKLEFTEPKCFQQQNGYDCGLFTLLFLRKFMFPSEALEIDSGAPLNFRKLVGTVIESMALHS